MECQPGERRVHRGNPKALARQLPAVAAKHAGWRHALGKVHAAPGAPRTNGATRPAHPAGQMLEMPYRITQKTASAIRGTPDDPRQCRVGRRVGGEHRIVRFEIGHPCLVELEHRLGRLAGNPLRLGVSQRVEIEIRAAVFAVAAGDGVIHRAVDGREMRAWRVRGCG